MSRKGSMCALVVALIASVVGAAPPAGGAPSRPGPDADIPVAQANRAVPERDRVRVLGEKWSLSSDRAVLTSGDATGLHVLVADAAKGYDWRTAATLAMPGMDTDLWVGNACVTGSGRHAVVAYGPRAFTNKPLLADRGAFTAVVDLTTGAVTRLPVRTSLAYFNPSCGAGDEAVLTQEGTQDLHRTRLLTVNAATATIGARIEVAGQLTSAVPTPAGIIGAAAGGLVRVEPTGATQVLAATATTPFKLAADAEGGVVFMERMGADRTAVRRLAAGSVSTIATGDLTTVDVVSGRGGRVFVTGAGKQQASAPGGVTLAGVPAGTRMSLDGGLAITSVWRDAADPDGAGRVTISANVAATGQPAEFSVPPAGGIQGVTGALAGDPHDPGDFARRVCAVPRNDPRNQAMQPKPRQVEWAVDQAVRGVLTVSREANWKNLGMPAYTPQGLFPSIPLRDSTANVPAQVMLGVAATESNLWQAARFAVPGVTSNPLIGNYYGIDYYDGDPSDDWTIDWSKADCGYGVTQVTDHMRINDPVLGYETQRAVALDFAANIAAGLRILQTKWNEVKAAGLTINNGDPAKLENWFYALWAYNSGFHPDLRNGTPWGVGWVNNPINPRYPANRAPFLEFTYADAANPQWWPYPEKVLGFAGHPVEVLESPNNLVAGFRAAWWNGDGSVGVNNRQRVKPPVGLFCDSSNECNPANTGNPCGRGDSKCWFHKSATWKSDCAYSCGNETLRFDPGYPYQEDGTAYPPKCDLNGLPSNAVIIDDVPDTVPSVRPGCGRTWTNRGTFQFSFRADGSGEYPGKVDTHQLGGGFGGHLWFTHTRQDPSSGSEKRIVTGTWTLDRTMNSWARVFVHLPSIAAWTQQARYEIGLGNSKTVTRYINQARWANSWVSLGVYPINGTPTVKLSSGTLDGRGDDDIAWDAVAFQALPGKPRHIVAALGDSYTSGEGSGSYLKETDDNHGKPEWNACRRSANSWPRLTRMPNDSTAIGALTDSFSSNHELTSVACSGADSSHVRPNSRPPSWDAPSEYQTGEGQYHEVAQVDSGALTEWTTLVVLTIGGNDDNGFAKAIQACAPPNNCADDPDFVRNNKTLIDRTESSIGYTLDAISANALNATIVLVGYPELFVRNAPCIGFNSNETAKLAELVHYLNAAQLRQTLGRPKTYYADPSPSFVGHGACATDEWINSLVVGPNGGGDWHEGDRRTVPCLWGALGDYCISRESLHPKLPGTRGYAAVVEQRLRDVGYG